MNKRILLTVAAVLLFMMLSMAAAEDKDCWYLSQYGDHDFEQTDAGYATCEEDGYYVLECRQCGLYRRETTQKPTGHKWKESYREEPTDYSAGIIVQVCSNCGESRKSTFYPDGTLYRGIKAPDSVRQLQSRLIDLGYLNDKMDGVFGKNTEAAVKGFQKAVGLNADGIAWPQTLEKLETKWLVSQQYTDVEEPAATAEPTAQPAAAPNEERFYPDFCYLWEDENGSTVYEYCKKHADMFAAQNNLLSNPALIDYSYDMWKREITSLYDEWIALLPEGAQESVAANKAFCLSMMDAQRKAMLDSYDVCATGIHDIDAEYGMELWMRAHAAWLCQMLNTLKYPQ